MNGANWQQQWYRPQQHHQTAFSQPHHRVQYPQQTYYHQPLQHHGTFPQQQQATIIPTPDTPLQCPQAPVFAPVMPIDSTNSLDSLLPRGTPFPERQNSSSSLSLETPNSFKYDENSINTAVPLPIPVDMSTESEDSVVKKLQAAIRALNAKSLYYINFCLIPKNKTLVSWCPTMV